MIRRAEEKDITAIMDLLYQVAKVHNIARPDLFKDGGTKYTPDELRELLSDKTHHIFVYEEDGKVLAHLFAVLIDDSGDTVLTDKKTLYIDDICVDKDNRGKHIASALYDFATEYAKELGCYNLTLNVWAGNDPAMEFYKSRGMDIQKYGMEVIL